MFCNFMISITGISVCSRRISAQGSKFKIGERFSIQVMTGAFPTPDHYDTGRDQWCHIKNRIINPAIKDRTLYQQ